MIYRETLAFVHHRGLGGFIHAGAPELLKILRANGITSGRVADLGCGDGTWLRALTRAGFAATGIDQSAAFAKRARVIAPGATVRRASIYRTGFPACDAITALGEVFNYLPRDGSQVPSLPNLFRRAYAALRPDGLLIFDLLVSGPPMHYEVSRVGSGLGGVHSRRRGCDARAAQEHIVAFRRKGTRYTRDDELHVLRVPARAAVLAMLRDAGFTARAGRRYGGLSMLPRRAAFIARKPRRG
jgi:SAM-dependent methyltransferase